MISLSNTGGTETIDFHTSCSAPIETGDVYGSLSLTALDGVGVGSGKDVLYSYLIQNMGSEVIRNISVTDDKPGPVGSGDWTKSKVEKRELEPDAVKNEHLITT